MAPPAGAAVLVAAAAAVPAAARAAWRCSPAISSCRMRWYSSSSAISSSCGVTDSDTHVMHCSEVGLKGQRPATLTHLASSCIALDKTNIACGFVEGSETVLMHQYSVVGQRQANRPHLFAFLRLFLSLVILALLAPFLIVRVTLRLNREVGHLQNARQRATLCEKGPYEAAVLSGTVCPAAGPKRRAPATCSGAVGYGSERHVGSEYDVRFPGTI